MAVRNSSKRKTEPILKGSEMLRTAITLFTGFMILLAISAVVLSFYGPALQDTAIYRNLSDLLPPVINVEIVGYLGAGAVVFGMHALGASVKMGAFEYVTRSDRRRRQLAGIAAIVLLASIFLVLIGYYASSFGYVELGEFASKGIGFTLAALLSAIAIGLMYFVLLPKAWHAALPTNLPTRLAAFVGAILLLLLLLASTQVGSKSRFETVPTSQGSLPHSTHSISAVLEGLPNRMSSLSNRTVTLKFRLTPYDPHETADRYPVSLDSSKQYSVSATIEGTGFDIGAPPEALTKPRPIVVNNPMTWTWLIAPKPERAGSRQMLLVRLFLHDRTSGQLVYMAPIVTHVVEVRTPLGLPAWALSPGVTIGAVLIALVSLVGNFLLPRIWPAREDA